MSLSNNDNNNSNNVKQDDSLKDQTEKNNPPPSIQWSDEEVNALGGDNIPPSTGFVIKETGELMYAPRVTHKNATSQQQLERVQIAAEMAHMVREKDAKQDDAEKLDSQRLEFVKHVLTSDEEKYSTLHKAYDEAKENMKKAFLKKREISKYAIWLDIDPQEWNDKDCIYVYLAFIFFITLVSHDKKRVNRSVVMAVWEKKGYYGLCRFCDSFVHFAWLQGALVYLCVLLVA